MSQADGQNGQHVMLVNHLKLIDDLWQKLFYVKWNAKSFAMLGRLAQDMVQFAQSRDDIQIIKLVAQLEHHVSSCLATGGVPQETDRQRLTALIDALHHGLVTEKSMALSEEPRTRPRLAPLPEIFLITPDERSVLVAKLEDAGYRVRLINDLAQAEERLHERMPGAILLDIDFPEGQEQTLGLIASLRAQINLRAPVLVLSERNDMAARLEAVRIGSAAYFTKPVDADDLLGVIGELLLPQTAQDYYRVLIVNDRPTEAWEMAGAFEEQGITPLVVIQPLQVLQDIHRFRP
ncbi:MAG: response regulator, partial [Candidatus Competibacter sp.]|nr:response regulator [Candidatus Competibacter sp.]